MKPRTVAALDELLSNNVGHEPLTKPAAAAKDAIAMVLSACQGAPHRVDAPVDEDTQETKAAPSAA